MKIKGFKDTIKWYDQNAKKYAQAVLSKKNLDQMEYFTSLLPSNGKILDAGSAGGRDSKHFFDQGYDVTGIDISEGMVSEARKFCPKCNFQVGDFLNMEYEDESFDGVWAHASLVHLETEEEVIQALKEFYRVLKPSGILHILVKVQMDENKTRIVKDKLSDHFRFFRYYTLDEMKNLLLSANFIVDKIRQYNEADGTPEGRPEVDQIVAFAKKK